LISKSEFILTKGPVGRKRKKYGKGEEKEHIRRIREKKREGQRD
jgi:hypothetical protein